MRKRFYIHYTMLIILTLWGLKNSNAQRFPFDDPIIPDGPCLMTIPPDAFSFGPDAGSQSFTVQTEKFCKLVISDNQSWITTSYSALSKTVTVAVTQNTDSDLRSGIVTLENFSITIRQEPYPVTPSTISVSNQCGKSILTRGTPPSGVTWYWQGKSSSGTSTSNSSITYNATSDGTYYLRARDNSTGAWSISSRSVLVNVKERPSTPDPISVSNQCGKAVLTRENPPSGITWYWQTSSSGTSTSNSEETYPTESSRTYYLRARNDNTGCWSLLSSSATTSVKEVPSPPAGLGDNRCGSGIVHLMAQEGPDAVEVRWFDASGNPIAIGNEISPTVSSTTDYKAKARNSVGCYSDPVTVEATVNPIPDNPISIVEDEVCGNGEVTLTAQPGSGGSAVNWYTSGGSYFKTGTSYTTNITSTKSFIVKSNNPTTGCVSSGSTITATANPIPDRPINIVTSPVCEGQNLNLSAEPGNNGNNINWYNEAGDHLATGTVYEQTIDEAVNFLARTVDTNTGCESSAKTVPVTPNPIPANPLVTDVARCGNGEVTMYADLPLEADEIYWYNQEGQQVNKGGVYPVYLNSDVTYTVKARNSETHCISQGVEINGVMNPKPEVYTLNGESIVCEDSGVDIELDGSEININYDLLLDGQFVDSKNGTGNPIVFENRMDAGVYSIVASNPTTECSSEMQETKSVSVGDIIDEFYVTGNIITCSNKEDAFVKLLGSQDSVRYQLLKDGNPIGDPVVGNKLPINFGLQTESGSYSVIATNQDGCSKEMPNTAEIIIHPCPEKPEIGDNYIIEHPEEINLCVIDNELVYKWYTEDEKYIKTGAEYSPYVYIDRVYKVTALDPETGCESDPATITINVNNDFNFTFDDVKSNERNYIRKIVPKVPIQYTEELKLLGSGGVIEQLEYYDGLGRKLQTQVGGTGDPGDYMIQYYNYDKYGRMDTSFLPFTSKTEGKYLDNARQEQEEYYSDSNQDDDIVKNNSPWATVDFEESPYSRVLESSSVGDQWQIKSGTSYTKKAAYKTNLATDQVIKWVPSGDLYVKDSYYADGMLYKNIVTDENGITSISYIDKAGQLILKEQEGLKTYYIYDYFGRIKHVLPPEFVDTLSSDAVNYTIDINNQLVKQYCYTYVYGERSLLVEKYLPGIEKIEYVYDKVNRPVLSRNGNLRKNNQWSFVKYDRFGRVAYSGIWTDAGEYLMDKNNALILDPNGNPIITYMSRAELQVQFNSAVADLYEEYNITTDEYSNDVFPQQNTDIHVLNVYDAYPDGPREPYINEYDEQVYPLVYIDENGNPDLNYAVNAKGNLTYSKVKVLDGSNTYLETVLYYDKYNRVIQKHSDNIYGMIDIVNMKYNFMGQVIEQVVDHQMPDANSEVVSKYYSYDQAGRLKSIEQEIEADTQNGRIKMVELEYNKLGQVMAKKMHETATDQFLQTVDFEYNIRGWLTGINDPGNNTDGDLFAMKFYYDEAIKSGAQVRNNGMISGIKWKIFNSNVDTITRAYAYTYDNHYSLINADYFDAVGVENYDVAYNYTTNGKISSLERYGKIAEGQYGKIDDLTYTYTGNQLAKVDDAGLRGESAVFPNNFPDLSSHETEYLYDDNGNMYEDKNKGLEKITYNHLNLPDTVRFDSDNYIIFTYDALGNKLEKFIVEDNDGGTLYILVGGFTYKNDTLVQIATEEGMVEITNEQTYDYQYFLKDHLGSTRVVFSDDSTGNNAEILQETHYYPFGMTIDGLSYSNNTENRELFSGKEYISRMNLNWYDFGARNYDPSLGMWFNVDPMAERYHTMSPYHFTANNPVNFRETNGMEYEWKDPEDNDDRIDEGGGGAFAAPNSVLYALLGGYGNMFGSDFFRNSMDEGSNHASLTTDQHDILQGYKTFEDVLKEGITVTGELAQKAVSLLQEGHTVTFTEYHFAILPESIQNSPLFASNLSFTDVTYPFNNAQSNGDPTKTNFYSSDLEILVSFPSENNRAIVINENRMDNAKSAINQYNAGNMSSTKLFNSLSQHGQEYNLVVFGGGATITKPKDLNWYVMNLVYMISQEVTPDIDFETFGLDVYNPKPVDW